MKTQIGFSQKIKILHKVRNPYSNESRAEGHNESNLGFLNTSEPQTNHLHATLHSQNTDVAFGRN